MKKLILILGGARSGKSKYALDLAKKTKGKVVYVATCVPKDKEMKERVKLHRKSRPFHWKTIEQGKNLNFIINNLKERYKVVIIDCLTLYISNLMHNKYKDVEIIRDINKLARNIKRKKFTAILVSNELGSGIVPKNKLARRFRDIVGMANQIIAEYADQVYLLQAGIPVRVK